MNAQDKAELRRLAEAMPNLDWDSPFEDHEQTGFCCVYAELFELDGEMHDGPTFVERCHPDQAKFIAEAKESVLSLLDDCEGVTAERDDALAELESLRIQVSTLTEWYSNALDVISEVSAAIPGVTYMDPPDGGDVSIPEQIQRMAKDAERYRWIREQHNDQAGKCWVAVHQKAGWVSLDSAMLGADRENDLDLDSAVRAAMSQEAPNA